MVPLGEWDLELTDRRRDRGSPEQREQIDFGGAAGGSPVEKRQCAAQLLGPCDPSPTIKREGNEDGVDRGEAHVQSARHSLLENEGANSCGQVELVSSITRPLRPSSPQRTAALRCDTTASGPPRHARRPYLTFPRTRRCVEVVYGRVDRLPYPDSQSSTDQRVVRPESQNGASVEEAVPVAGH